MTPPTPATNVEIPVETNFDVELYKTKQNIPICWVDNASCSGSVGGYSACNRTVCTVHAVAPMCSALTLGDNTCSEDGVDFNQSCSGKWTPLQRIIIEYRSYPNGVIFRNDSNCHSGANAMNMCYSTAYSPICANGKNSYGHFSYSNTVRSVCQTKAVNTMKYYDASWRAYDGVCSSVGTDVSTLTYASSVRCVLMSSKYDFVGGGGGSRGAYIDNIDIATIASEIIKKCIDENLGCSFKASVGKGGKTDKYTKIPVLSAEADVFTSKQAQSGGDSSIVIVTSSKDVLWKISVKGGEGGYSGTITNGGKAGKIPSANTSCEICEGSSCSYVSCSSPGVYSEYGAWDGLAEKQASYSIHYPKYSSCCASVIPSGRGGYFGYGKEFYPGAGGTGTSASVGYFVYIDERLEGFDGQDGDAQISYDAVFSGASGGGGGGGAFTKIKNVSVPANGTLRVRVGLGGTGGSAGTVGSNASDGKDGVESVIFDSDGVDYIAGGGKGGKKGVAESTANPERILGKGGLGGVVEPCEFISTTKGESSNGLNGYDATLDEIRNIAYGGNGGISGISVSMQILETVLTSACGGLSDDRQNCHESNGIVNANGSYFDFDVTSKKFHLETPDYGLAGQGGAGGGWKLETPNTFVGVGGKGNDGYVYIYW